jgi:hypothetical protein
MTSLHAADAGVGMRAHSTLALLLLACPCDKTHTPSTRALCSEHFNIINLDYHPTREGKALQYKVCDGQRVAQDSTAVACCMWAGGYRRCSPGGRAHSPQARGTCVAWP